MLSFLLWRKIPRSLLLSGAYFVFTEVFKRECKVLYSNYKLVFIVGKAGGDTMYSGCRRAVGTIIWNLFDCTRVVSIAHSLLMQFFLGYE